jgi:transposase-like protein
MGEPKTLQEAIQYFADFENCKAMMMELRWPDGKVKCPECGSFAFRAVLGGKPETILTDGALED